MYNFLFLIPAFPFAGFLILALAGRRLSKGTISLVGTGSVGMSAFLTMIEFIGSQGQALTQTLWTWMKVGGFSSRISFTLDALSLVMIFVITFVGFLIHLYSAEFMLNDEGYSRFFAYMNLFVGSMLTLVLADNLLLLYFGWEGVGLCSYLLIGFWYKNPANGAAARKAFIVTRVGDTSMAIGLFLLYTNLGTLNIQDLMQRASAEWQIGSPLAIAAAALLLGGAVGKSAQLPLQTWLPDAMAGPTPVSALIHAATMVTAGVYLIARTHALFLLAPPVMTAVAIIGATTLLIAGFSALVQRDIKRVLAYSTISQLGYMFLALGVGAWSAAMFHLMTHAFFKALLFLGAGIVILAQHEEHDMFKMGGLRKRISLVFWTFLIGAASLSALPLVTAGFYSKDLILGEAWSSPTGGLWLWLAGLLGALITSLYTFRMVFVTFFGKEKLGLSLTPGRRLTIPLIVLAFLSMAGGFVELPKTLGDLPIFSNFLSSVFPAASEHVPESMELLLQTVASLVSVSGIVLAYVLYLHKPALTGKLTAFRPIETVRKFWLAGWGFDALYDVLLVRPFVWVAGINKDDIINSGFDGIVTINTALHRVLSKTQTGSIRWYAAGIAVGVVVFLGIVIVLS